MVFNVVLVASFAAVLIISKDAVGETNQQTMEETHWANTFPPLGQPLKLPLWLLETHAGAMLGYPVGGPNWGSTFSLLCVVVAVTVLVRRRQWLFLGLLLAPLGLNFIAAALHRFPYGGHARMTLFLAPALCTLIALGLTAGLTWIESRRRRRLAGRGRRMGPILERLHHRPRPARAARCWLMAPRRDATLQIDHDLARPRVRPMVLVRDGAAERAGLVRDRLEDGPGARPAELRLVVALLLQSADLFAATRPWRAAATRSRLRRPAAALRIVSIAEGRAGVAATDPQARQKWLNKMQAEYDLVALDTYPFAAYDKSDRRQTQR